MLWTGLDGGWGIAHRPQFTIKDLEFDMEPCTRTQFGPMGPKVYTHGK